MMQLIIAENVESGAIPASFISWLHHFKVVGNWLSFLVLFLCLISPLRKIDKIMIAVLDKVIGCITHFE